MAHAAAKLPNYKTVHRRFQSWCNSEVLRQVLTGVANELRDKGVLDEEESFIDATFAMAQGGGAEISPTKRGKGMKIMAIVDRYGLLLSVTAEDVRRYSNLANDRQDVAHTLYRAGKAGQNSGPGLDTRSLQLPAK